MRIHCAHLHIHFEVRAQTRNQIHTVGTWMDAEFYKCLVLLFANSYSNRVEADAHITDKTARRHDV